MKISLKFLLWTIFAVISVVSCKKFLPGNKDSFADDSRFTQDVYSPTLGRTTVYNTFNAGNSTQPLTFKIMNPRTRSGEPAQELLDVFPVKVWKAAYTGLETSVEEIEKKRAIENHRVFEIREHSGQFIMWPVGNSAFVKTRPDSGYVFDIEVSNSGGRKYFREMKLMPYKERKFEPNPADPVTGQGTGTGAHPIGMSNVFADLEGASSLSRIMFPSDVHIFFYKKGAGNSITFKFLDTLQNPINPDMFRLTDWKNLIHGFNMEKTDSAVKYQVAYPIPLTPLRTKYTSEDGTRAIVNVSWDRLAIGGLNVRSEMKIAFSIYEEGEWEVLVWFREANPKFRND